MNQVKQLIKETKKYLTKYDYDKVIELCDKILEIDPKSCYGLRFNAISYFQTGNYQKGLDYYNKLYEYSPDEDTIYSIAYLNEKLGRYEKALEFYDKLGKKNWLQSKRKHLLTKMKSYQVIIDEYDEKLKELDKLDTLENTKRKIVYLEEKAVFQYRNKEYNEAQDSFKEAALLYQGIDPKSLSYLEEKADGWYKMLQNCLYNNHAAGDFFREFFNYNELWCDKIEDGFYEYEDLIVYGDLLLELNQSNVELLRLYAFKYKFIDYDYSLDCWKKILEIEPENREAIEKILELYSYQYSKDKALELINQKLYIKEIQLDLLARKIRLLESMTLYDDAISVYDEYLSINNENALKNLTTFDKLRCMEQQSIELYLDNQLEKSFRILKEVNEIFQEVKDLEYTYWADPLDWYTGVLDRCIKFSEDDPNIFFEKYLRVNYRTVKLWNDKIQSLIPGGHLGNPITYCNILLEKNRDNVQLLLTKAYVYYITKRLDESLDIYNHILKLKDNNEAKNYKFNILVKHHQYKKAYQILKSMKMKYSIVNNNLFTLAEGLKKNRRYEESLYVYETIFEEIHRIDTVKEIKFLQNKLGYAEKLHKSPYYMNWIDLINYKYTSDNCPTCGNKLTPILYGYPLNEAMDRAEKGEIILGGCCVSYDDPTHYCKHCEKNVDMGVYRIYITNEDEDLASYTRRNIRRITEYIKNNPNNTIRDIEKNAYKIGIDYPELTKFIEKLEEIGHIKKEKNNLKIIKNKP